MHSYNPGRRSASLPPQTMQAVPPNQAAGVDAESDVSANRSFCARARIHGSCGTTAFSQQHEIPGQVGGLKCGDESHSPVQGSGHMYVLVFRYRKPKGLHLQIDI